MILGEMADVALPFPVVVETGPQVDWDTDILRAGYGSEDYDY